MLDMYVCMLANMKAVGKFCVLEATEKRGNKRKERADSSCTLK